MTTYSIAQALRAVANRIESTRPAAVPCMRCRATVVLTPFHTPEANGGYQCDRCEAADRAWHIEMNPHLFEGHA